MLYCLIRNDIWSFAKLILYLIYLFLTVYNEDVEVLVESVSVTLGAFPSPLNFMLCMQPLIDKEVINKHTIISHTFQYKTKVLTITKLNPKYDALNGQNVMSFFNINNKLVTNNYKVEPTVRCIE